MKKIVSYRQKIIELARIYKIEKVLDINQKLTTYEIELELLKNKVPIPSRRGYFSHKVINEFFKPLYGSLKNKLDIDVKLNKRIKSLYLSTIDKLTINISLNKFTKKIFDAINNYFIFVISSIANFFKTITKIVVDNLNNLYNFKVNEKIINRFILRGIFASVLLMFVFSGFYIKGYISNLDSVKISLEIKSDKNNNERKEARLSKKDINKKKSEKIIKKTEEKKTPYDPENDYNLNTLTVLNLFEDLEYDLDSVRNSKLVKPIYFTRLPKDLDSIRSTKKKKETFLKILLPLIVAENEKIEKDKKYLLKY